ncbi:hypothetical protein [Actinoplanes sp. OR16]|nr:hypothetical protein [Actinoplanes sp. OR16]
MDDLAERIKARLAEALRQQYAADAFSEDEQGLVDLGRGRRRSA